jgi:hypothetical protein
MKTRAMKRKAFASVASTCFHSDKGPERYAQDTHEKRVPVPGALVFDDFVLHGDQVLEAVVLALKFGREFTLGFEGCEGFVEGLFAARDPLLASLKG